MLHIACSCDARFAPDCGVMLTSMLTSNEPADLHVHLLHDASLMRTDLNALREIVTAGGARFEAVADLSERAGALRWSDRFPLSAWYRVLLPVLLPDLPRILYIDADTIVREPLESLWSTQLDGKLLGAVTNPLFDAMVPRVRDDLGLPDGGSYFNSGVLLIDLDAWRANDTSAAILDFAQAHPNLPWPDQDALNAVLHAQRLHLHPRWNAMPGLWELSRRYLPYPANQAEEAARAPAIVHFVGPHKPWHYRSRHPYRGEFFRLLATTPWREREIEGRTLGQAVLRPLPWLWAYRIERAAANWPRRARSVFSRARVRANLGRFR